MTEDPIKRRADGLSVGDRILAAYLPAVAGEPAEVVFAKPYTYVGDPWVFVAFELPSGLIEATHYKADNGVEVYPAPDATGQLYSRPADSDDPQPSGGREPLHTGAWTDSGLVDETRPDPTGLDEISDEQLREAVHWRSSGLPYMVIACGAESGPHSADVSRVTCPACLDEVPF